MGLVDTHASNEELYLFKKLLKQGFDSEQLFFPDLEWEQPVSDFFINSLITSDKSPNRAGARMVGLEGSKSSEEVTSKIPTWDQGFAGFRETFEDENPLSQAGNIPLVINIAAWQSGWSETADVTLPGRLHSEKRRDLHEQGRTCAEGQHSHKSFSQDTS